MGEHTKSGPGSCVSDLTPDLARALAVLPCVAAVEGALPPYEPVLLQSDMLEPPPAMPKARVRRVRFEDDVDGLCDGGANGNNRKVVVENDADVEEAFAYGRPRARTEYDLESLISGSGF